MLFRQLVKGVSLTGVEDWNRRLFDSLIPLPDGTSYNSYLVAGDEKTALIDTVDPAFAGELLANLSGVKKIDYIISNHSEQDHSGTIPEVLGKFPEARVVATPKGAGFLADHLGIPAAGIIQAEDGKHLSLGGKTLRFIHAPWVHWPETMVTYLEEDKILFSCDLFGSHIASNSIFVKDPGRTFEAAKRYYAEIMMPFRKVIQKNMEKLKGLEISMIAPSHGQVYGEPASIMAAYSEWISDVPRNKAVIPYISMHGSTKLMVSRLAEALTGAGVEVELFELSSTDIGRLAISLVDAATAVFGTPTVHTAPHPLVLYAALLANALRPKLKYASVIGSYGWATNAAETIVKAVPNLKVEVLAPVICKGLPRENDYTALDKMALEIADKHRGLEGGA